MVNVHLVNEVCTLVVVDIQYLQGGCTAVYRDPGPKKLTIG